MPLNLTKVAYGAQSLAEVHGWFADGGRRGGEKVACHHAQPPQARRGDDRRLAFWILKHQLVARSEILGFAEAENGRTAILISPS
jgi:hypothetical protein